MRSASVSMAPAERPAPCHWLPPADRVGLGGGVFARPPNMAKRNGGTLAALSRFERRLGSALCEMTAACARCRDSVRDFLSSAEALFGASCAGAGLEDVSRGVLAGTAGAVSSRLARRRSWGRSFSQRNSINSRRTPSLVGEADNCRRRSWSPPHIASDVSAAAFESSAGEGGEAPPSVLFVSAVRTPGGCATIGSEGAAGIDNASSSARADCAWSPFGWAARNPRHPSIDFVRSAIR